MKKIRNILILTIFAFIFVHTNIFAASISAADSATVGDTITLNVNFGFAVGVYESITVTANGSQIASEGYWEFGENTKSGISTKSYTFKPTSAGTYTITFTAKGVAAMDNTYHSTVTATKTITVKDKVVEQPSNNNNNSNTNTTKSSNNYLKSLRVDEEGLTPGFSRNIANYAITVGEKVEYLKVSALAEDSAASVAVSGNTNLKNGDNTVYIVVIAQDGAKRTYKIIVTKTANAENSNAFLENLILENITLNPEFSSENLEYDGGTVGVDVDKISVFASAKDSNAKVEIIGNENLVAGENIIKIRVTAANNETVKEYIVKIKKEEAVIIGDAENVLLNDEINPYIDLEADTKNYKLESFKKNVKEHYLEILMILLIFTQFAQILYYYLRDKKNLNNNSIEKKEEPEIVENAKNIKVIDDEEKNVSSQDEFDELDEFNEVDEIKNENGSFKNIEIEETKTKHRRLRNDK